MTQPISMDSCKAILEQGINKGKQCEHPQHENGYCKKHQKQAILEKAKEDGKIKCLTYRCNNTIIKSCEKDKYCESCIKQKNEIKSSIIFCKWEEKTCKDKAKESGYCGKHEPRALILEKAKEGGYRICDDAKRACKNKTIGNNLKCEECLSKNRKKENNKYQERKEEGNLCLTCGKEISEFIIGIRGHTIQKCQECYNVFRNIEDKRSKNKNYKIENKLHPLAHYKRVLDGAAKRGLEVDEKLTVEIFIEFVNKPCEYCGHYIDTEAISLDRIDSNKGYLLNNIVPCCELCNTAKGILSVDQFENHILKIAEKIKQKREIVSHIERDDIIDEPSSKSYLRPDRITELYVRGKIQDYINLCIEDKRSAIFIQKIQEISNNTPKHSAIEFKRLLKLALFSDSRARKLSVTDRKRIPRKEMFGLFNLKNIDGIVKLYERTFGKTPEFKEDVEWLSTKWDTYKQEEKELEFNRLLVKYQNKRAHS
jgi:hypothetical protein